ncbi:MAG: hypothetical protein RLW62_09410 [Gammaproteobacteria bacterium]
MSMQPTWPARLDDPRAHRDGADIVDFGDAAGEAACAGHAATRAPRGDLAVVALSGSDARTFLHGQVSANLVALAAGDAVHTAWCSPKGRVLFLLTIIAAADGLRVLVPRAQCDALVKRLRMFVLRAAVTVEAQADAGVVVLDAPGATPVLPSALLAGSTRGQTWLCGPADALAACWDTLPGRPIGAPAALLADIRHARPRLAVALAEQFLPQELDLDRHAGVSFDKGCYPGQEIIARVRFRGSVKRRLARLAGNPATLPAPGTRLHGTDGETPCGTVLMAAHATPARVELLAVLDVAASDVTLAGPAGVALERFDDGDVDTA